MSLDHSLDLDGLKREDSPLMPTDLDGLKTDDSPLMSSHKSGGLDDLEHTGSGDLNKSSSHNISDQAHSGNQVCPVSPRLDTEEDMAQATNELFAEPLISPVKDMETNHFFS